MRLPSDPRCRCDPKLVAVAMLEQRDPEPCPVHQADRLAALEDEQARAATDEKIALLRDAKDTLRTLDELDARRRKREQAETERADRLAELDKSDPMLATVIRKTGAPFPSGSTLPLNAPPSSYPALRGMTDTDPTTDFDGPDAA